MLDNEEQLQTLFNAIPDFVLFKDGEDRWLKVNQVGKNSSSSTIINTKAKRRMKLPLMFPGSGQDRLSANNMMKLSGKKKRA